MSAISDFKAAIDAHFDAQDTELAGISTAIEGVTADVTFIKSELERLNNTPGPISAEDQAILDGLISRASSLTTKLTDAKSRLTALDELTPPAPPSA